MITGEASDPLAPRRAIVLGVTGSGKTTAARRLARAIGAQHVELDALYHGPNWQPAETPVFRERVAAAIARQDAWVTDGGYASHVWDLTWTTADTVVWLDYPLPLILWRLFRRTMSRWWRDEELWNGNKESLRAHFMSRDSLFLWALQSRKKYRVTYPEYFARTELSHLRVLRFRSPKETERWFQHVERSGIEQ
jgi:adenylate kinase family enzyme